MKTTRPTFAGRRRLPELWGLEREALYVLAGAWSFAAMLLSVLAFRIRVGWPGAVLGALLPAILGTAVAVGLLQGKPRGHWRDWLEEHLAGRASVDTARERPPRRHDAA